MDSVSVILPTYNERDNIGPLVRRVLAALDGRAVEVIVVDDASPDGTSQVVEALAGADPRVRLHRRQGERGLTSAIWAGIERAGGDVVVWMDCDLSMPPEKIPALLERLAAPEVGVAIGSRYVAGGCDPGHSATARLFSRAINSFAGLLLGRQVRDYTSGFVAARRSILLRLGLRGDYGEYCIDLLCRAGRLGFQVAEVPYTCGARAAGESKTALDPWGFVRRGRKYVATILRLAIGSRNP